jgi:group II intron reverse transcriptase/maturase
MDTQFQPPEGMKHYAKTVVRWITNLAERLGGQPLSGINHKLDRYLLAEAHTELAGNRAAGIDDESKADFAQDLTKRVDGLLARVHEGSWRAPAVKRVEIPKGDGKTRPLGISTYENKVLQKAFVMLVEPVFEREFHPGSYGYRPGRSVQQAVKATHEALRSGHHWVIEMDIKGYFDSIPHQQLREMFRRRITDGVLNRLVLGWLKAGVMKEGAWEATEAGTPQGGIVSPLLANLYLNDVLDQWIEHEVKPRIKGGAELIRYADDAVICFKQETDARRVYKVLHKRFEKYGLKLHPEKTKLVHFQSSSGGPGGEETSFKFLGFHFYMGKSRQGHPVPKEKTDATRQKKSLKAIWEYCQKQRHKPLAQQQAALRAKVQGYINHYAISNNLPSLEAYVRAVKQAWLYWLNRRGSPKLMHWEEFEAMVKRWRWVELRVVHKFF